MGAERHVFSAVERLEPEGRARAHNIMGEIMGEAERPIPGAVKLRVRNGWLVLALAGKSVPATADAQTAFTRDPNSPGIRPARKSPCPPPRHR